MVIHRIITALENALFPPRCLLDAGPATQVDLADHLVGKLRPMSQDPHCPRCAQNTPSGQLCGHCLRHPPAFEQVQAAFWLDETLKQLLHKMKYGARPDIRITRLLSQLACEHFDPTHVDALVPIPLHPDRLLERGFNQADFLAKDWGKALGLPVIPAAKRVLNTPQQAKLDAKHRHKNLINAFKVDPQFLTGYQRVAIVDDVLTTGSTAHALAQTLKTAHPNISVEVWVVARTRLL